MPEVTPSSPTRNELPASFYTPLKDLELRTKLFSRRRTESDSFQLGTVGMAASLSEPSFDLRNRTISHNALSAAFGPALFAAPDWGNSASPEPLISHMFAKSSSTLNEDSLDQLAAVERTLGYLDLDEYPSPKTTGTFASKVANRQEYSNSTIDFAKIKNSDFGTSFLGSKSDFDFPPKIDSNSEFLCKTAFTESQINSGIAFPFLKPSVPLLIKVPTIPSPLGIQLPTAPSYSVAAEEQKWSESFESKTTLERDSYAEQSFPDSPTDCVSASRSLWIGNIDSTLGSDELYLIFSKFGVIESVRMLPEKECAFVNYAQLEDAILARDEMQGGRVGSCIVRIGYGKIDSNHDNQGMAPTKSLWVGNIVPSTKPSDLEVLFGQFGQVESARVLTHKNCGFVNFIRVSDAITARNELNGREVSGAIVKIGYAKVPSKSEMLLKENCEMMNDYDDSPVGFPDYVSTSENSPWRTIVASSTPIKPILVTPKSSPTIEQPVSDCKEYFLIVVVYATSIPQIPESNRTRRVDQTRLRDIRKKLEGHCTSREIETLFTEIIDDAIDLCSDYIGNVVIQKIVEKCNDSHRQRLIDAVADYLAAFGIHKNGTWAVQKIIECAKTPSQIEAIVDALRPYTPALLLDQFGNYVVQCCLRLGEQYNKFVFDAMIVKCWELGQGRFGARAMRACLESRHTSKKQQKDFAVAIIRNSVQLSMNPNGMILITWLMELTALPGRFRALSVKLSQHIALLCCHKLASSTLLKVVTQRAEMDARDHLIRELFYHEPLLQQVLQDANHGIPTIQKIISTGCVNIQEKMRLADCTRSAISSTRSFEEHHLSYKRLIEDLDSIPVGKPSQGPFSDAIFASAASKTSITNDSNGFTAAKFTPTPSQTPSRDLSNFPTLA